MLTMPLVAEDRTPDDVDVVWNLADQRAEEIAELKAVVKLSRDLATKRGEEMTALSQKLADMAVVNARLRMQREQLAEHLRHALAERDTIGQQLAALLTGDPS